MAVDPSALTTLATVLDELGLTEDSGARDARLERYINSASAAIARYCSRQFHRSDGIVERLDGHGGTDLVLGRRPVLDVTSVVVDGATLDAADYELYDVARGIPGILYRHTGWPWTARLAAGYSSEPWPGSEKRSIVVTYDGGWVTPEQNAQGLFSGAARTLPYDLEDACVRYVTMRFQRRSVDPSKQAVAQENKSYNLFFAGDMPPEIATLVNRYKMVVQA